MAERLPFRLPDGSIKNLSLSEAVDMDADGPLSLADRPRGLQAQQERAARSAGAISTRSAPSSGPSLRTILIVAGVLLVVAMIWKGRAKSSAIEALTGTLEERGHQMAARYLTIGLGCVVDWKAAESSRVAANHLVDFWAPAIAAARSRGATTTDAIASDVAKLIVPECVWPPAELDGIDLEQAVDGLLEGLGPRTKWASLQAVGRVRVYLGVRAIVRALAK